MGKIITTDQLKKLESLTFSNTIEASEKISEKISNQLKSKYKKSKAVVMCGSGCSGGYGYIIAWHLLNAGWDILVLIADLPKQKETEEFYNRWLRVGGKYINFQEVNEKTFEGNDLIIDSIFGSYLSGKIEGDYEKVIDLANNSGIPIISIDVPTGVIADNANISTSTIKATETYTFNMPRLAHILSPSKEYCGKINMIDIGISENDILDLDIKTFENTPNSWKEDLDAIKIPENANKYTRGLVLIDSNEYGATIISAKSAKKSGAGMVYISCNDEEYKVLTQHTISDIFKKNNTIEEFEEIIINPEIGSILIGNGNENDLKEKSFSLAKLTACPIIFDGNVITAFKDDKEEFKELIELNQSNYIFMCHAGEFKRLFEYSSNDKINSVKKAAQETNSIVVLKENNTIIASPNGEVVINLHTTPYLSICGSGDVLSGIISALIARGMDNFKAVCCGIWMHGHSALKLNKIFSIEELIDNIDIESIY